MTLLLVGGSYAIAFVIGLLVGRTRQRVLALALGGVTVAGAVVAGYVLTAGCETLDCLVGAFFLAMFVVIWLAGVGAAALVRRADVTPEWRTLAAVGSALLVVVGTTLVLDRYANDVLRWGCGSWPEPHRSLPFKGGDRRLRRGRPPTRTDCDTAGGRTPCADTSVPASRAGRDVVRRALSGMV